MTSEKMCGSPIYDQVALAWATAGDSRNTCVAQCRSALIAHYANEKGSDVFTSLPAFH